MCRKSIRTNKITNHCSGWGMYPFFVHILFIFCKFDSFQSQSFNRFLMHKASQLDLVGCIWDHSWSLQFYLKLIHWWKTTELKPYSYHKANLPWGPSSKFRPRRNVAAPNAPFLVQYSGSGPYGGLLGSSQSVSDGSQSVSHKQLWWTELRQRQAVFWGSGPGLSWESRVAVYHRLVWWVYAGNCVRLCELLDSLQKVAVEVMQEGPQKW